MSHPPSLKLANAISDITTILLNGVLPQVHDKWFKGCWKTVELPFHLLCDNIDSMGSTPVLSALKNDVVTFADVKTLFTAYCLPCGVIHELYACINKDTGFERENWWNILMENLIDETMESSILRAIHNVCTGV
ncbi:hypothetical protein DFH29DRAFT_875313 [Suillus ampliporus]|nr:hypothetical protein DFH29DRAFT_875313 [Suillus ampliporus]